MRLSRAPHGFVELRCADLRLRRRVRSSSRGSFGHHTYRRARGHALIANTFAGFASDARAWHDSRSRRARVRTISRLDGLRHGQVRAPFCSYPFAQRGELDRDISHSSHRGPSVHRRANQAARNLRRPGRDRHRERAACSKNWKREPAN